jgi:hypothetical protein
VRFGGRLEEAADVCLWADTDDSTWTRDGEVEDKGPVEKI